MFRRPSTHYGKTPATRDALPDAPPRSGTSASVRPASRRSNWRLHGLRLRWRSSAGFAAALVWQSARGTVAPWVVQVDKLGQAQAVAPGDRRLSADRSADRLASRALHRAGALDPRRSGHRAPELAARLRLRHRPGRARAQRLCPHQRSVHQGRQAAGRGRRVAASSAPRRRQLPRRLDRAPLSRTARSPRPSAGPRSSPSSCSRRATPSGCGRIRSASTSTPSTGRRSSADARTLQCRPGCRLSSSAIRASVLLHLRSALAAAPPQKPPRDHL